MTRAARGSRGERGFTLMEVLASLVITIIGLAGVLMMQATTTRANRDSGQFTRAANIAEETMEAARGTSITTLLLNPDYEPIVHNDVTYNIDLTAAQLAGNSNLIMITVSVSFESDDELGSPDRVARVQMIRTRTETL